MNAEEPPTIAIRRALPGESKRVTSLGINSKAVWGYTSEQMHVFSEELIVTPDVIQAGRCFVLCVEDAIAGYYTLNPIDSVTTELQHLFVDSEHLRSGYGSKLFRHAVKTARALQFKRLAVQSDPNAVGFYQRHGMPIVKETPSSIPGRLLPWLELLLEVSLPTKDDHVAFSDCIESGNIAVAESLITLHPTLVNHPDWTPPPLHCAVLWDQPEMAQLLLDHGADTESLDPDRATTPLRYAVMYCRPELIRLLVKHGANAGPIVDGGSTAIDLAKQAAGGAYEEYDDLPTTSEYAVAVETLLDLGFGE